MKQNGWANTQSSKDKKRNQNIYPSFGFFSETNPLCVSAPSSEAGEKKTLVNVDVQRSTFMGMLEKQSMLSLRHFALLKR
jgi:hypothetical protein